MASSPAERSRKLAAALKAAGSVALLWACVPALIGLLLGAEWLYENHARAVEVVAFYAVVGGFSAAAGAGLFCMFRSRSETDLRNGAGERAMDWLEKRHRRPR